MIKYRHTDYAKFAAQEAEARLITLEKSGEMFCRLEALGVKYTVFQDCVEIDAPPEKLEAVQNMFRELWTNGVIGG